MSQKQEIKANQTTATDAIQKMKRHLSTKKHHTKVGIDCLTVEITRKCNAKPTCKHCMRGLPQNVTLNKLAIDNLLSQVAKIGEVGFTGGEPLLCIKEIRYFFEVVKKNKIPISEFKIITNGLLYHDEFEKLIFDVENYISSMSPNAPDPHIIIGVSIDQYHNNNHGETFIKKCEEAFSAKSVSIEPQIYGGNPVRMGLAKMLPDENTVRHFTHYLEQTKIAIFEPFSGSGVCPAVEQDFINGMQDLPYILCPIYLSATGKIYGLVFAGNNDYLTVDQSEAICNLNYEESLLNSIKMYNRNRLSCMSSALLYNANNLGNGSMRDMRDREVDELLNLIGKVQPRYSKYPSTDRQFAHDDMEAILETQKEYAEESISLSVSVCLWLAKLRSSDDISHYLRGDSPYTKERASIIRSLLDVEEQTYTPFDDSETLRLFEQWDIDDSHGIKGEESMYGKNRD